MMWIRSQDRTQLIKFDYVDLSELNINGSLKYGISAGLNGNNIGVATYPTKQRALEVLDEIEKAIEESNIMRYEYFQGFSQQLIEYTYKGRQIYQMPKEWVYEPNTNVAW